MPEAAFKQRIYANCGRSLSFSCKCISGTVRALGYPGRQILREWIKKKAPDTPRPCKSERASVYKAGNKWLSEISGKQSAGKKKPVDRIGIRKSTEYGISIHFRMTAEQFPGRKTEAGA